MSKSNKKNNIGKIERLSKIINTDNEYRPPRNHKDWVYVKSSKYQVMKKVLKYEITDDLIDVMKKYTKIYKSVLSNRKNKIIDKFEDNIALIYLLENKKTKKVYIGYTTNSLFTFLKLNLHKNNMKEENIFDYFSYKKLTDFKIKLLEYVHYESIGNVRRRKRFWQGKLLEDYGQVNEDDIYDSSISDSDEFEMINIKLYKKRMDFFWDIFKPLRSKFKSFKGYIYRVINLDNEKVFIYGSKKEDLKLDKIVKTNAILEKEYAKNKDNFKKEIIDKYLAKSIYDFMLRIDFYKLLNDSVDTGYNLGYCLEESKDLFSKRLGTRTRDRIMRKLFLKMNRYLVNKNLVDDNYNKIFGFVYQIKNKNNCKRFFSYAYETKLKDIILRFYDNAIENIVKHSKIMKVLSEEPYYNFEFSIVVIKKRTDNSTNIEAEAEKLIEKYDTLNNGYNIDTKKISKGIYYGKIKKK